ncbi:hypothetical protein J3A83DRAFT_4378565 [Scleroderma citrinum]
MVLPSLQSLTFTRSTPFYVSLVVLVLAFYLCAPRFTTVKQRSWILTTISSAIMSIASLPLAWDFLSSSFDLMSVQRSNMWTYCASRFFQAYLIADITLGLMHYRSKVNILTGWIHHSVYVFIVEYSIRKNWSYIFCLCAVMEIPTFVLASASLNPRLRSDTLFAITFFSTRIALHLALCTSLIARRAEVTDGSLGPGIIMACIFPLHAFWFSGCVKGFIRRNESKRMVEEDTRASAELARVLEHTISPSGSPHASIYISPRSSGFSRRRSALRLAVRQRWDQFSLSRAGRRIDEVHRRLRAVLPMREFVYEYVGLERGGTGQRPIVGDEYVRASSPSPSLSSSLMVS